jgi:hypothetical protein
LHAIFQGLDKSICRTCTARTFGECATVDFVDNRRIAAAGKQVVGL